MSVPPTSRPEPSEPAGGRVVDAAVMAERRARRAELGERAQAERAQEAEDALATLESELDGLELRLAQATDARRHLEEELGTRERELRAARQEAYAEQRLRLEATERAAIGRPDERSHAEARARELQGELDALRRRTDEAAQAIAAATAARRRAEEDRDALVAAADAERQRFDALAGAVEGRVQALRERLDGALGSVRAELEHERTLRRRLEAALEAERRRGAARHGAALEAAEAATLLEAELVQRSALQGRVEHVMDGLQGRVTHLGEAVSAGRRREFQAQALVAAAVGDVRDALLSAETRVAEAEREVEQARTGRWGGRRAALAPEAGSERGAQGSAEARAADPPALPPATTPPLAAEPATAAEPAIAAAVLPPVPEAARRGDWLRRALADLAADDPDLALEVLVAVLPAARPALRSLLPLELELPQGVLTLTAPGTEGPAAGYGAGPSAPRTRVRLDLEALLALLAGASPRRLIRRDGPVQVTAGSRRRARRLGRLARVHLGFPGLHRAGLILEPRLAYALLARAIAPEWTGGVALRVAHELSDHPAATTYLTVRSGERPTVSTEAPDHLDATVRTGADAFLALLGGETPPDHSRATVRGDLTAVAALMALTDRAQGLATTRR